MLFAEEGFAGPSPNVLTVVLGQLGVVGALVWYLWYQTSTEMPRARRDFLDALAGIMASHADAVSKHSADWRQASEDMHQLVMAFQDLTEAIREAMELRRPSRPSRPGASTPGPTTGQGPRTPAEP